MHVEVEVSLEVRNKLRDHSVGAVSQEKWVEHKWHKRGKGDNGTGRAKRDGG